MFFTNLKYSIRYLWKFKTYSAISIIGFTIGLCSCILIALYVQDDLGYDAFHEKVDNIYRLVLQYDSQGATKYHPNAPAPIALEIAKSIPEIETIVRFADGQRYTITNQNREIQKNTFLLVDKSYFDIFDVKLVKGDAGTVFRNINSVVITQSVAHKLFGDYDPIDQVITVGTKPFTHDYTVTHVVDDPPSNSRFQYELLASFEKLYTKGNEGNLSWSAYNYPTYVLLNKNSNVEQVEKKLSGLLYAHNQDSKFLLQPLLKTHIDIDPINDLPTDKDSSHIYIFIGISVLILILACFNYINMTTLQIMTKEKEIGLRKVIGAKRHQLSIQFVAETMFLMIVSLIVSLVLATYILPIFNHYTGKEISLHYLYNFKFMTVLLFASVLVGSVVGIYPAFYLSKLKPISNINKEAVPHTFGFRGALVVLQFTITILFMVCMFVMRHQMQYTSSKKLGYDKDHLIVLPIYENQDQQKYDVFKTEILKNASIKGVTATSYLPSEPGFNQNVIFKGEAANKMKYINWISVDYDFINTFGLELKQGGTFSGEPYRRSHKTYILNESAVKQLGWDNPIGEPMKIIEWGEIAGVVKDFNFESLHHKIEPMAIYLYPELCKFLLVRVDPNAIHDSIEYLSDAWNDIFQTEFSYSFYDKDFDNLYRSEIQQNEIFSYISGLSIFISVLGLLGLTLFTVERRTREIGIRKVLGSSVQEIILMIISDFVRCIVYANLFAWPIAWFAMHKWLENFAYRINITVWPFLLAGTAALLIAMLTVSLQVIKAATADPVKALRYE